MCDVETLIATPSQDSTDFLGLQLSGFLQFSNKHQEGYIHLVHLVGIVILLKEVVV